MHQVYLCSKSLLHISVALSPSAQVSLWPDQHSLVNALGTFNFGIWSGTVPLSWVRANSFNVVFIPRCRICQSTRLSLSSDLRVRSWLSTHFLGMSEMSLWIWMVRHWTRTEVTGRERRALFCIYIKDTGSECACGMTMNDADTTLSSTTHCRASVFSIVHFYFSFANPDQISDHRQSDLDVAWSFVSRSPAHVCMHLEVFHLILWSAWNHSKATMDPGLQQRSKNLQHDIPATHSMSISSAWQRQCSRVVLGNYPSFGTKNQTLGSMRRRQM